MDKQDYIDILLNKIIGNFLRREREKQSLTLEQLAKKSGISKQNIYYYEIARNRIKLEKFIKICKALNLDTSASLDLINIEYIKKASIKQEEL